MRLAAAVDQAAVAGRGGIGMQGLQRVDQHAGDVLAVTQHLQGPLVHFLQRVGVAGRQRVAGAGLHVFPPAVVSPAEAHQVLPPGVVAGQAHGLHHGFGAAHVEADLVQARDFLQLLHVPGHGRVVAAQDGAQVGHAGAALGDAGLVEVVAEDVDAVAAGQVVEGLAVQVEHLRAVGALGEGADADVFAQVGAVGVGHPVGAGELQVADALAGLPGQRDGLGMSRVQVRGQAGEALAAAGLRVAGRAVAAEEVGLVVGVAGHLRGHALGHPRVAGQRRVLGARQRQALAQARPGQRQAGGCGQQRQGKRFVHSGPLAFFNMTVKP